MKSSVKIAVVHSRDASLPKEANPWHKDFDAAAPLKYIEGNIQKMLGFLHEAGRSNADLACTHEDFIGSGVYHRMLDHPQFAIELCEEIPGPASQRLGEIAKQYSMYIAANYYEKDGDKIYNTAFLIDRKGEIAGKYRKVHLPPSEKWRVTAGEEFPAFETDIGRIGFATCYDMYFPEHCRALAMNGAEIIIHQTQGWGINYNTTGEAVVRTRAVENSAYLVVVKNIQQGDGGKSCIIDNCGNILAEAPGDEEKILTAEFEPNYDQMDADHFNSMFSGVDSIKARLALERVPELYSVLTDEKAPVLERFKAEKLHSTAELIEKVYRHWKEYEEAVAGGKPLKVRYHW